MLKHFLSTTYAPPDDSGAVPAEPDDPSIVGTPTPEPGPTPTPPEPLDELKPLTELLGEKDPPELAPVPEPPKKPDPASPASRINKLTAEKWEERRKAEAAEARARLAEDTLSELARADPETAARLAQMAGLPPPAGAPSPTPAPTQRPLTFADVQQQAAQLAAAQEFNTRVNELVVAGRAAHPDFDAAIGDLKRITGDNPNNAFVQAAMDSGEASEVLYSLGKNPGEADRILSLPLSRQIVEITRFADGLRAKRTAAANPEPSRAPQAITPKVSGRATEEMALDDPKLPLREFIRRRNEADKKARQRA
jgi:hypothetical protein